MIVYLLLNQANLKGYVGQHKGNKLSTRWNPKFNLSKVNPHLRNAIKKYGYGAFSREILNVCSTQAEMDNLENLWIVTLRTYDKQYGYNKVCGGRYCRGHTDESKERISAAIKRVWLARSHEKHAQAVRQWWRSMTESEREQVCQKMSQKRSGQKLRKTAPPWNKGLTGLPSARKGRQFGPQKHPCPAYPSKTEEHRRRISEALKMHFVKKRLVAVKKPPQSVKQLDQKNISSKPLKRSQSPQPIQNDRLRKRFESLGGCSW